MAVLKTNITDAYEPQAWSEYFVEQNTAKNQLVQAGILASDPEISAKIAQGGRLLDMPFWNDLPFDLGTGSRSSVATDTDDEITPDGIDYSQDIAVVNYRTKAWQVSPLVKYVAGSDPVEVFLDRQVNWWLREKQRLLLKILAGLFGSSGCLEATHVNSLAGEDGTNATAAQLISNDAIEDTRFLLGDAYDKFTGMMMHSTVFKRLRSLDLIDTEADSAQNLMIQTYQGLRVIVDDGVTKTAGSTSGYKYDTFLFGQGAIAYEEIPTDPAQDPNIELYRQPLKGTGAGALDVITRSQFVMHPRGCAWQLSPSSVDYPTDTELETVTSWSDVWLAKNIRIAKLVTNG